jgi:hypothetical protein
LAWCRAIVELPRHKGGVGITPLPASGVAAFYSATAHLVSWLGSLPHASEWVVQNLADLNTWNSSGLQTLKQLHGNLLTHYNCTEWAPPLADDDPAPDAPAQGHDDDSDRPLSLPQLILLASLRVQQDEDNGEVATRPSLPPQRQVTKHIMQTWTLHEQVLQNPPTDRMRDVHMFHHTPSVPMFDETSALHGNMPQHNDEEGGKQPLNHVSLSPLTLQCGSRWAAHGRQAGRNAPRTTESIRCQRFFFAGFATSHKRVLTSEGHHRADLEIRNIRVAQQIDLLVDVTLRPASADEIRS